MPPANLSFVSNGSPLNRSGPDIIAAIKGKSAFGSSHYGAFNQEIVKRNSLSVSRSALNTSRPFGADLSRFRFGRSQAQTNLEPPDSAEYTSIAVTDYPADLASLLFSASGLQSTPNGDIEIARRMQAMDGSSKALKSSLANASLMVNNLEHLSYADEGSFNDAIADNDHCTKFVDANDCPAQVDDEFSSKKCIDNCGYEFDSRQEFQNLKAAMLKAFR